MTDLKAICDFLESKNIPYLTNVPLAKYTTFGIGGSADIIINLSDVDSLRDTLCFLNKANYPYTVIGNGSNLWFQITA